MVEVAQRAERGGDGLVGGAALDVDDERHPAGVVLEARVVEPRRVGEGAERHPDGRAGVSRPSSSQILECTHIENLHEALARWCRGTTLARLRPSQISGWLSRATKTFTPTPASRGRLQGSQRKARTRGERRDDRAQQHVRDRGGVGTRLGERERLVGEGRERGVGAAEPRPEHRRRRVGKGVVQPQPDDEAEDRRNRSR